MVSHNTFPPRWIVGFGILLKYTTGFDLFKKKKKKKIVMILKIDNCFVCFNIFESLKKEVVKNGVIENVNGIK